jgi:hypothetical protein
MKNKIFYAALAVIIAFSLIFNSCRKDKDENETYDVSAAGDDALAENIFNDIFTQVKDGMKKTEDTIYGSKDISSIMSDSSIITISPCITLTIIPFNTTWPKNLIIDFGSSNCQQNPPSGRYRRGKILVHCTGRYRTVGSVFTTTVDNYYVDDNKVEGTKTVTNTGYNIDTNLVFSIHIIDAVITKPNNGGTIHWNSDREREWINGESTILNPWDDEYSITGTQNGISANGKSYNITITSPLNVKIDCRWVRSGTLDLNIQDVPTIAVDYGNGNCDANAVATVNGVSYPFIMN